MEGGWPWRLLLGIWHPAQPRGELRVSLLFLLIFKGGTERMTPRGMLRLQGWFPSGIAADTSLGDRTGGLAHSTAGSAADTLTSRGPSGGRK